MRFDVFLCSLVIFTLIDSCIVSIECARILAIEPIPAKSHWNFISGVLRALTSNGHHVTVFTPFPEGDRDNYTEVDMSSSFSKIMGMNLVEFRQIINNKFSLAAFNVDFTRFICDIYYNNKRLKDLLVRDLSSEFDVIIVEPTFPDYISPMFSKTHVPLILTMPVSLNVVEKFHNPATVSPLLADHAIPVTFAQRLSNTVSLLFFNSLFTIYQCLSKIVDPKPFEINTIATRPSLTFVNGHFISEASNPLSKNVINVGGVHLKPAEKLSEVTIMHYNGII